MSMAPEEKEKLAAAIRDQLAATAADITAFRSIAQPVSPDNAIGRLTRMEAIGSKSINESALRKARERRSRLERALTRLDDPDFGLCRECEEPIAHARLLVMPEADLCVSCAERLAG